MASEPAVIRRPSFISGSKCSPFVQHNRNLKNKIFIQKPGFGVSEILLKQGVFIGAMLSCLLVFACKRVLVVEGVVNAGDFITTLWPWNVRELAEKESEDGVFQMLHRDVTWFLTTILIGTTVVNIGAIALVIDAATAIFGEVGVSATTGVMTIQKKTGYIAMRAEGVYDVDANTSIYIYLLSEDLNIKMPEEHQCEAVSGFVCEVFGYIPRAGESIKVALKRVNQDDDDKHDEDGSDHQDVKEWHQIYRLEILAANAQKVSAVRFEWTDNGEAMSEANEVTRLIPKIMKRKGNNDKLDNITYDENAFRKRQGNCLSDCYVVAEDILDNGH
ncbi:hypothetical protein SLE2022_019410 [Rubroshorea leprosula]